MFILDLETLDIESSAVILSAAILHFDETKEYAYDQLLSRTCFVKFNLKEQVQQYKRTVSKETIAWWKSQSEETKKVSFYPSDRDTNLLVGLNKLKDYVDSNEGERIVWVRGTLDQITFNSLCKAAKFPPLFPFKNYMETRTAINLLKETAKSGYCDVPGFDKNLVIKHNPIHDVCYDALQILSGT